MSEPVGDIWMPSDEDLKAMSDDEVQQVLASLVAVRSLEPAWEPQPKQALATYLAGQTVETLYGGAAGGGKAHALSTQILTKRGWLTMGTIKVGDYVRAADGSWTRVSGLTETWVPEECYRLEFDDGAAFVADAGHRWLTRTASDRGEACRAGTVKTTAEIAATVLSQRGAANHSVDVARPLQGVSIVADMPIDPYLLGAWLGDGLSASGTMVLCEDGMADELTKRRHALLAPMKSDPNLRTVVGLLPKLRAAGILGSGQKRIPQAYLTATVADRLELLRGIMDTDGCCNSKGQAELTLCNEALMRDVWDLVLGLGQKARLRTRIAKCSNGVKVPAWCLKWAPTMIVFSLPRKAERQVIGTRTVGRRYLLSAERCEPVPVRCLMVEHPDHLWLVGRELVPTHNSEWLLHYALDQMLRHPFNRGGIFRRVFPSMARTLIPRAKAIYPQEGGHWNGVEHTWTFENGSVLEMGSLQYEDTVLDHQGAEYGFIAFEEITEFLESQVTYLIGRLRSPAPGIRPHLVATANPGGRGHRWVKRRWVKPKPGDWASDAEQPCAFKQWQPIPTLDNPNPNSRIFVPATLADNPRLLARDPGYINRLRAISDRALRKAMEHGDWDAIDAIEGALWAQSWLDGGRVSRDHSKIIGSVERVVAVDPSDGNESGHGDEYGVWVGCKGSDGVAYTEYSGGWLMSPRKMAEATVALYHKTNADAIIVEKNHGGAWVKEVLLGVDRYANIKLVWASDGKITRARPVAALFEPDASRKLPYRARLAGHFEELEEELTTFTGAPGETSPNQLDAMVWGHTHLVLGNRQVKSDDYKDERLAGRR